MDPGARRAARSDAIGGQALRRDRLVIHELANLLDGSMRLIELARRTIASPARTHADAERALRHLDSARAALAHIASLTRPAPTGPAAREAGSLAAAIRSAVDVLAPAAAARDIALRADADPAAERVPAGPIYAVITNALHNAIEAVGTTGMVEIRARIADNTVEIDVLDDGIGPPAEPRRAFEPGFSTRPGSAGIGLALAREVVEELGGTIELLPRGLPVSNRPGAVLRVRYPEPGGKTC